MPKKKFPTLAIILLITAVLWLLSDLFVININIPWIPIVLIIVAIGMIFNRFNGK